MYRNRDMQKERETLFVDRLHHASIAYNYDCDRSGSLCATTQSKQCYLKIIGEQINQIKIETFPSFI
jgi:hypothetical protein